MLHLLIRWPRWLTEFFDSGEKESDPLSLGFVTTDALEYHALSTKENFYLLELVEKKRRVTASAQAEANKLAYLAFSFVVNAAINAIVGRSIHGTLLWKILDTSVSTNGNVR